MEAATPVAKFKTACGNAYPHKKYTAIVLSGFFPAGRTDPDDGNTKTRPDPNTNTPGKRVTVYFS